MSVMPKSEIRDLRPSMVIAEALVDRQRPAQIVDRARELGCCRDLTQAMVHACCRGTHDAAANAECQDLTLLTPQHTVS